MDTTGSTAFYKDETESGGDLQLAVEVFDWQIADDPMGIAGQVESIWIESETLFNAYYSNGLIPVAGSQPNSGIYNITIPNVTPAGLEGQEILITVRAASPDNSYAPPMSGPAYPESAMLAAYKLVEVPVKSIEPDALAVTSPNGGETWGISSEQTVTWASYGEIENVNIDLSLDGGENYTVNLATDIENDGVFTIGSVGDWPTTEARVRVSNAINPDVFDSSDADFTIEPFIQVIKPNGYELIPATTSYEIKWVASDSIESVGILLSQNSGENYVIPIAYTAPNNGSFTFDNIPAEYIGDKNRIKIADIDAPSVFDESDSDFTILPEMPNQVILGYPNGGEELIAGTNATITWWADETIDNVAIKLSTDNGVTWPEIITDSTPSVPAEFEWGPIPQALVGEGRLISVFNATNHNIYDESDEGFTIAEPGIELLTPNGGEILEVSNAFEITWKASDIITDIKIEMSSDSGGTYPDVIIGSTPNTGSFLWDPIDDWPEAFNARIKISDVSNPDIYSDESNGDFVLRQKSITLTNPDGGQTWRLGFPQTINWSWTGYIPLVDIMMSIEDGDFDTIIKEGAVNTGSLDIASFFPPSLTGDHMIWEDQDLAVKFRIAASDDPMMFDASESSITVRITLGILEDKNNNAAGDTDDDGIRNTVEGLLETDAENFDTDRDGMFDFIELFSDAGWYWEDLIPDHDGDGIIAPLDNDDDNDGTHDGELIDSDLDGIPNYLEYYGYTYNWLTGEFLLWDDDGIDPDFTVDYYMTDPMQPSTDQDPYGDGMETSGLFMDQSVLEPGDSPMIPAMPNIVIRLEGYRVTLNADISDAEGGSETEGTSWTRETNQETSSTDESNWEAGVSVSASYPWGCSVEGHFNWGESHSTTTTSGTSTATEESSSTEMNWSTTTSTNTTEAAAVKLFLKVYNTGTACASNIIPSFTLMVGRHSIATFEQGNAQINLIAPGGVYPPGDAVWVIDSVDTGAGITPIYLTINELRAFECGAPITIEMTQMLADVAAMDEYGHWQYVGDWNEYMARIDAVCTHFYLDPGNGNVISYLIYSDDDPSAPIVRVRDALIWSGAYEGINGQGQDTLFMPYRLPNGMWDAVDLMGCRWFVDYNTKNVIPGQLESPPPGDFNFADIILTTDSYIVGKAPPEPPLDKPVIHWAGYDSITNEVYVSATDYFAVKSVHFVDVNPSGSHTEMTYDSQGGYYMLDMPGGFSLEEPSVDYVYAINIDDNVSEPFVINKISKPSGGIESYPDIWDAVFEIREKPDGLEVHVEAHVLDDVYEITEVYLLDVGCNVLSEMLPEPGGWPTCVFDIEPDYKPTENEKILAINSAGYESIYEIPSDKYIYPPEVYRSSYIGYIDYPVIDAGPQYHDMETGDLFDYLHEGMDLYVDQTGDTAFWYSLATPLQEWYMFECWKPSHGYVKQLYDAKLFKASGLPEEDGNGRIDQDDFDPGMCLGILTTQGRLACIEFVDSCKWLDIPPLYGTGIYRVYSLYEGPYDEPEPVHIVLPHQNEVYKQSWTFMYIHWWSTGFTGNVKFELVKQVTPPDEEFIMVLTSSTANDGYVWWPEVGANVPPEEIPGDFKLRITSNDNPDMWGESGVFTITE